MAQMGQQRRHVGAVFFQFRVTGHQRAQVVWREVDFRQAADQLIVLSAGQRCAGLQSGDFLLLRLCIQPGFGGEEQAAKQHNGGGSVQCETNLPEAEEMPFRGRGELLRRRLARQQMHQQGIGGQCVAARGELFASGDGRQVGELEQQILAAGAVVAHRLAHAGRRQHDGVQGCVARNLALPDEVLLRFAGLVGAGAGDVHRIAGDDGRQPREAQLALIEKVLSNPGGGQRDEQHRVAAGQPARRMGGKHQRYRVNAGKNRALLAQRVEPGRQRIRTGQRGEENFFVAPAAAGAAEGQRRGKWRAVKILTQATGNQCRTVAALDGGQVFELKAFVGNVGKQIKQTAAMLFEVDGKGGLPFRVGRKCLLVFDPALVRAVGQQADAVEQQDALGRHQVFILVMTS